VKTKRISIRMGTCAKLVPRYFGPFEVLKRIGLVAYKLSLTPTVKAHNVLHVPLLKKYVHDYNHVIDWTMIQVEPEGKFQPEPHASWTREKQCSKTDPLLI
jgi:hypothetical protein